MAHAEPIPPLPRGPRIALLLMFVFLVLLPIAVGALDSGDIRCTREAERVHCEYAKALVGIERARGRVEGVIGARLDFKPVKKARGSYTTVLLTPDGEVRLPDAFNWTDDDDPSVADLVSNFVASRAPSMSFSQAGWGVTLVLSATVFWAALWFALPWLSARAAKQG